MPKLRTDELRLSAKSSPLQFPKPVETAVVSNETQVVRRDRNDQLLEADFALETKDLPARVQARKKFEVQRRTRRDEEKRPERGLRGPYTFRATLGDWETLGRPMEGPD